MKITAKIEILRKQFEANRPLAAHEFGNIGYSENNIATRCPELRKAGLLIGCVRSGTMYKEWQLADAARHMISDLIANGADIYTAITSTMEAFKKANSCELIG